MKSDRKASTYSSSTTGTSASCYYSYTSSIASSASSSSSASSTSSNGSIKSSTFREQMSSICRGFDDCNTCEQTVALCFLFKRLNTFQIKFLSSVLNNLMNNTLKTNNKDLKEIERLEEDANNPVTIDKLRNKDSEYIARNLLIYLPLLRSSSNESLKAIYLTVINELISYTKNSNDLGEDIKQVLCYAIIHPAMNSDDRRVLSNWCRQLEEKISLNDSGNDSNMSLNISKKDLINKDANSLVIKKKSNGSFINDEATNMNVNKNIGANVKTEYDNHIHSSTHQLYSVSSDPLDTWRSRSGSLKNSNAFMQPSPMRSIYSDYNELNEHRRCSNISDCDNYLSIPSIDVRSIQNFHDTSSFHLQGLNNLSHESNYIGINTKNDLNNESFAQLDWQKSSHTICDYNTSVTNSNDIFMSLDSIKSNVTNEMPSTRQICSTNINSIRGSSCSSIPNNLDGLGETIFEKSGMKDVPIWLKGLRLHKYCPYFATLSYEQMMDLTENDLEAMNITKGARHKIILNINKLKTRQASLESMAKALQDEGPSVIKEVINELKYVLGTPIKAYDNNAISLVGYSSLIDNDQEDNFDSLKSCYFESDKEIPSGDLPSQITSLMGKVCATLLMHPHIEDEIVSKYQSMLVVCINHEAFTEKQKIRCLTWKQQIEVIKSQKISHFSESRQSRGRTPNLSGGRRSSFGNGKSHSQNKMMCNNFSTRQYISRANPSFAANRHSNVNTNNSIVVNQTKFRQIPAIGDFNESSNFNRYVINTNGKIMKTQHGNVHRTNSAPLRQIYQNENINDLDLINNQTEKLCLQITEQTLNGGSISDIK